MKNLFFLLIVLFIITGCSGKPYVSQADKSLLETFEGKEPTWSFSESKNNKSEENITNSVAPQYLAPLERKAGSLSFEEWQKAKEANSQEYQDYLEYRDYLQTIQSVPASE